jgi:small subunit ribosomal protein S11
MAKEAEKKVDKKADKKADKKLVKKPVKKARKKSGRNIPQGIAFVKATFNNTLVTITDPAGNVVAWSSAGKANFSGSKKSSAFAGTIAAQNAGKEAASLGMKECEVNLKGPGAGRESAVRGLQSAGLNITVIRDTTPVPHNGCRPRKRRRV